MMVIILHYLNLINYFSFVALCASYIISVFYMKHVIKVLHNFTNTQEGIISQTTIVIVPTALGLQYFNYLEA